MVDAIVSVALTRLLSMLEERVREEFCLAMNSKHEAAKLSSNLEEIQEVLDDAERKGVTDPQVKSWLDKLQDISYDVGDALDEWDWQIVNRQMEDASRPSDSQVNKVTSLLKSYLCCHRISEHRSINLNIKQLNERLELIGQQNRDEFNFIRDSRRDSQPFERIITTSFVNVREVHGRKDDKELVVSKLLSESSSQIENDVKIVSIVGVGGMGKTTLAQLVLKDSRIDKYFQKKIWVCVSDPFDEIKIAKAILEALNQSYSDLSTFDGLLGRIERSISGTNFLLVLDDVWTEDDTMWKPLRICLGNGAHTSRILVTTRNTRVAKAMGSTDMLIHTLIPLSDRYCWSILSQIAFHDRTELDREILKQTGLGIVKKCKGLPLAAKAIGGLLRFKPSLDQWREVLESEVWEMEKARTDIFPFMVLSYDELHPTSKRCFSYCAFFPKDTKLDVDELIRIWCAQGFLSSSDDMELRGREVFDDLAMRSFFQDFKKDEFGNQIIVCKMHDIVHDFAQFLTKNECSIVKNIDSDAKLACYQKARHLNLPGDGKIKRNIKDDITPILRNNEICRSLYAENRLISPNICCLLKRVKMLTLIDCGLEIIPREIGSLIHLRYLNLSRNHFKERLVETICNLYNLQTLVLVNCFRLSGLPQRIQKLRNLRHLLCDYSTSEEFEFPKGIEELTNLRTLNGYIYVSNRKRFNVEMLRNWNRLIGELRIRVKDFDGTDDNIAAVEKADLKSKIHIRVMDLRYFGKTDFRVMEALQPPPNLEYLYFLGYLPKWITTLTNLRKLDISHWEFKCGLEHEMEAFSSWPAIGKLPFLEVLSVNQINGMRCLKSEFFLGKDYSDSAAKPLELFPRLKKLSFSFCVDWEEWEDISEEEANDNVNIKIFPCLQSLKFSDCASLKELPHRLMRKLPSSLNHIQISPCCELCIRYKDCVSKNANWMWLIPISYFRQL